MKFPFKRFKRTTALSATCALAVAGVAVVPATAMAETVPDRIETTIGNWYGSDHYVFVTGSSPSLFDVPYPGTTGPIFVTMSNGAVECLEVEQSSPYYMLSWAEAEYTTCQDVTTVVQPGTGLVGFMAADGEYQGRYLGDYSGLGIVDWDQDSFYGIDVPAITELTEVTPGVPVLVVASECGVEATVSVPEVEGVVYEQSREGNEVTVTASAAEGFVLAEGVVASWVFDVAAKACPTDPAPADTLPETGANGSMIAFVVGLASVLGGGIILTVNRRNTKQA